MPRLFMVRKRVKQKTRDTGVNVDVSKDYLNGNNSFSQKGLLSKNIDAQKLSKNDEHVKDIKPHTNDTDTVVSRNIAHIIVPVMKPGYEPFVAVPENIGVAFRPYQPHPEPPPPPPVQAPPMDVETINQGFGIKNPLMRPCYIKDKFSGSQTKFICRLCGHATTTKRKLQRHLQEHSEVKKYFCSICGKGFNDTFDLKRHTRTHTGVRPYPCDKCGRSFTQRCTMEAHVSRIHGQEKQYAYKERRMKMFVCEMCGFSSSKKEDYVRHLERGHHVYRERS